MAPCNTTLEDAHIVEDPLWHDFTFHHFGLLLCAIFGLISVVISLWLIAMHALHYLRPNEQKHIIRILFMIPVYSVVSFLSYMFYRKAVYFEVLRDCYEAFAISSFFSLLCYYIAPDLHEQKEYFRGIQPKNWFLGVFWLQKCTGGENKGPFRKPRSGLTWFNVSFEYTVNEEAVGMDTDERGRSFGRASSNTASFASSSRSCRSYPRPLDGTARRR